MFQSTKMNMDGGDMMEKILNLALEILCLLTGEDYIVVKKSNGGLEGLRTEKSTLESSPHARKDEKILHLTNKIIEVLSREVPIRYDDITVSFTMEEWEYVEEHKSLYKDIIAEDQQHSRSLNGSLLSNLSASTHMEQEPSMSIMETSRGQDQSMNCAVGTYERRYIGTDHSPYITKNSSWVKGNVTCTDYTPSIPHVKEEFLLHGQVNAMGDDICTPNYYNQCTSITDEPISCQEGSLSDIVYYTAIDSTQYIHTLIMDESVSQAEGKLSDGHLYTQVDNVQFAQAQCKLHIGTYEKRSLTDTNFHKPKDNTQYKWTQDKPPAVHYERGHIATTDHGKTLSESTVVELDTGEVSMPMAACAMEKPFHCLECGKSFTQSANLIRHQKIHKGETLFACLECGKCFSRNANLVTHRRIHTGEKPFTCPHCSKCFKQYSTLVVHKRIHTGEKPFSCLECNKCFTHRTSLVLHQRIHKGEKPYLCSECGKCFVSRSQLKYHLRIPTGEKTIALHGCTLKSLRMSEMNAPSIF